MVFWLVAKIGSVFLLLDVFYHYLFKSLLECISDVHYDLAICQLTLPRYMSSLTMTDFWLSLLMLDVLLDTGCRCGLQSIE